MLITIEIESDMPLFAQLINEIKRVVQQGLVKPGDPLPSIRQLAGDLDLNNKTVAKAYRLLERDNIIVTKGYRGTFVHAEARQNSTKDLNAVVQAKLNTTIAACRAEGATDSEIRIAFGLAMQSTSLKGA